MARNVRKRMIEGALHLIARRGVQGTSFAEVTQVTGTPRGSIYHHFPGGKSELVVAALAEDEMRLQNVIVELPTTSAADFTRGYITVWRDYVEENKFEAGSVPVAVAVAPEDEAQLNETRHLYSNTLALLIAGYVRAGLSKEDATRISPLVMAALEGATTVAKAQHSLEAFDSALAELPQLTQSLQARAQD